MLSRPSRDVLARWAGTRVLLAFDYDGTLAPIVDVPQGARMRRRTRSLLETLAARYPCAIVSSRARDDVLRHLEGVRIREALGNHGLEPWPRARRFEGQVRRWVELLQARLRGVPGVLVENKRFSISIHYRKARRKAEALAAIRKAVGELGAARILPGKRVVNLLPLDAPHKGLALQRLRRQLRCATVVYVGDDATDEDVFALGNDGWLLGIRVGRSATSRAAYYLRDQHEVDPLLATLAGLRERLVAGNTRPSGVG